MHLPYDENTLREMELWPHLALQPGVNLPAVTTIANAGADIAGTAAAMGPASKAGTRPAAVVPKGSVTLKASVPAALPVDPERAARIVKLDWDGLRREAATCNACGLCEKRKQAVVGVGAENAPWLLVGEGPGAEEDQQGEPFVGQAGKLLDAMLAAVGLQRGREVYIANVVKCRPPGNRTPSSEESQACAPFLDRQIDLIQPKLILALGKTAAIRLTGSEASMASLRGRMHSYRDIPVVATYHPAYLLRNLPDKLKAWEDLMFAKRAFVAASR